MNQALAVLLHRVALVMFGVMAVVMAYGMYQFPHAPYYETGGQYVDKHGGIHSQAESDRLRTWERVFAVAWIASAVSAGADVYARRRR